MTSEGKIKKVKVLTKLLQGTCLWKISRHRRSIAPRYFVITEDYSQIIWMSKNKDMENSSFRIADILDVETGRDSDDPQFSEKILRKLHNIDNTERRLCGLVFAIVTTSRRIECLATNELDFMIWTRGLKDLVTYYNNNNNSISGDEINELDMELPYLSGEAAAAEDAMALEELKIDVDITVNIDILKSRDIVLLREDVIAMLPDDSTNSVYLKRLDKLLSKICKYEKKANNAVYPFVNPFIKTLKRRIVNTRKYYAQESSEKLATFIWDMEHVQLIALALMMH